LAGKRLAVVQGDDYARIIKRRYPKVLAFEQMDALGCIKAVAEGKADAAFGAIATYKFLAGMNFISDLEYTPIAELPLIKTSKIHMGVRYDWPILRTILQKGMNKIDYGEIRALHEKWLSQTNLYSSGGSKVLLTQNEQLYLRDKKILTMVVDPEWPPFESINDTLEHTGMAAD
ncbi:MAG: transporter substrate-binding domain-containing protein, partial [Planctomycetes bacterium]|nr:transporter substrate-binding domain-containing protein [Planctomycetota bacterium]